LPSRMNIGQLLEAHLGYAAKSLGEKIQELLDQEKQLTGLLKLLKSIYGDMDTGSAWEHIESMDETELRKFCGTLKDGVPMATYVFNGATEEDIERLLKLAKVPHQEKEVFYDGRTGDAFHQNITSGYMYMLKLNHLVEDKIHARSIGSYGLVTQQPLGGKSKMGGQRFGEMEVWALEAYGAAYTLQEMLTVKSDDVEGRKQVYKNIIDGNSEVNSYVPESFNVLIKEIRSLCLNIECK
ncbi:MAG: DNA-directed RNA polymerase subunit beta, partial [Candidatus Portiera sp.]|nr:DNA-directed RNA polymerase subunit beta [Portiera sp.]